MKRNVLLILLLVLLGVSIVMTYNISRKLATAVEETEEVKTDLQLSEAAKDGLEEALLSLKEKVSTTELQLKTTSETLQESQNQLQEIDDQLKGQGSISERIDALKKENEQWREQINELSMDLNEIQAQEADSHSFQEANIENLKDIQSFIDDRIQVLQEAVSNLSKLSVERIMVEQEVNFLEETRNLVKEVQDQLSEE